MRNRALSCLTRVALAATLAFLLVSVPIGCDDGAAKTGPTVGQLPPEAVQANKNQEEFMKTKAAAPKK